MLRPRQFGIRYSIVGIADAEVFVLTNVDDCINNKLVVLPLANLSDWSNIIMAHDPAVKLTSGTVLAQGIIVSGRADGLTQACTIQRTAGQPYIPLRFVPEEPVYVIKSCDSIMDFNAASYRMVRSANSP